MNDADRVACILARALCLADDTSIAAWARSLPEDEARRGVEVLEGHADRLAEHPTWALRPVPAVLVDAVAGLAKRDASTHRPTTWTKSGGCVQGDLIVPKWEAVAGELRADPDDDRLLELYACHVEAAAKERLAAQASEAQAAA